MVAAFGGKQQLQSEARGLLAFHAPQQNVSGTKKMPRCNSKLKDYRLKAKLSQNKLARLAELDRGTISRAEAGDEVSDVTLAKLVDGLNGHLPRKITMHDLLV